MAKIYGFEMRRSPGGVLCPPLGLAFPCLTRIVQTLSREELDAFGLSDEEPGKPTIYYTLGEGDALCRYPGTTQRAPIQGMPDADGPSLVIRRHTTEEHAEGYLAALRDRCDDEDDGSELCRTDQGLFTLAERPHWPGFPFPIVLYLAEHPANNVFGTEHWYLALAPDGSRVRLPEYEVPGSPGPLPA